MSDFAPPRTILRIARTSMITARRAMSKTRTMSNSRPVDQPRQ